MGLLKRGFTVHRSRVRARVNGKILIKVPRKTVDILNVRCIDGGKSYRRKVESEQCCLRSKFIEKFVALKIQERGYSITTH